MIAIRLGNFSVKHIGEERNLTLRYSSRICDRNNDKGDICECGADRGVVLAYRRPPGTSVAPLPLEELEKHCRANLLDQSCDNSLPSLLRCLYNRRASEELGESNSLEYHPHLSITMINLGLFMNFMLGYLDLGG